MVAQQLDPLRGLASGQTDYPQLRQELLNYFSAYCS